MKKINDWKKIYQYYKVYIILYQKTIFAFISQRPINLNLGRYLAVHIEKNVILHVSICGPAWIHVNTTVTDRCTHSFFNFFEKIKCKSNIKITCKYFLIYWYNVALRESYDIVPLTIVKKEIKRKSKTTHNCISTVIQQILQRILIFIDIMLFFW